MENTIGITLETGVGVQSAILHVCHEVCLTVDVYAAVPSQTHMRPCPHANFFLAFATKRIGRVVIAVSAWYLASLEDARWP